MLAALLRPVIGELIASESMYLSDECVVLLFAGNCCRCCCLSKCICMYIFSLLSILSRCSNLWTALITDFRPSVNGLHRCSDIAAIFKHTYLRTYMRVAVWAENIYKRMYCKNALGVLSECFFLFQFLKRSQCFAFHNSEWAALVEQWSALRSSSRVTKQRGQPVSHWLPVGYMFGPEWPIFETCFFLFHYPLSDRPALFHAERCFLLSLFWDIFILVEISTPLCHMHWRPSKRAFGRLSFPAATSISRISKR